MSMICLSKSNRVSSEKLQLVHLGEAERHNRVVIVHGVLHNQSVWLGLLVQDSRGELIPANIGSRMHLLRRTLLVWWTLLHMWNCYT